MHPLNPLMTTAMMQLASANITSLVQNYGARDGAWVKERDMGRLSHQIRSQALRSLAQTYGGAFDPPLTLPSEEYQYQAGFSFQGGTMTACYTPSNPEDENFSTTVTFDSPEMATTFFEQNRTLLERYDVRQSEDNLSALIMTFGSEGMINLLHRASQIGQTHHMIATYDANTGLSAS